MGVIGKAFYRGGDVVGITRQLIGKFLFTYIDGELCGGYITEAEAYAGIDDKASHAYGGRRTSRTEVMYDEGGVAYIYLCYGVHSMFNIVTNEKDFPDAILIRGLFPVTGMAVMEGRMGRSGALLKLADGPGKVTKALGIHYSMSGIDLTDHAMARDVAKIWLEDRGLQINDDAIIRTPRVGVDYAGEDAGRLYRFVMKNETRQ
jgi:DNA-3-methyladenine glycosylase